MKPSTQSAVGRVRSRSAGLLGLLSIACSAGSVAKSDVDATLPQRVDVVEVARSPKSNKDNEGIRTYTRHPDPRDPLALRAVAIVRRDKLVPGSTPPTFKAPCLSNSLDSSPRDGKWCPGEPSFNGPRLATASGIRVSQGWILTTLHGLSAEMPENSRGPFPLLVDGLSAKEHSECSAAPQIEQDWTWRSASVHEIQEIHCIPGDDLALVRVGDDDGSWQVDLADDLVEKLQGPKSDPVPVFNIGHPLGVPVQWSPDGYVYPWRPPEGDGPVIAFVSDTDDLNASSGAPVFHRSSRRLLGLVGFPDGGVFTTPTQKPGSDCYWIPHSPLNPYNSTTAKNARVYLLTLAKLNELRSCEGAGCSTISPQSWDKNTSCK